MKTTLQIFFAAYLYSKGHKKASAIANTLHIHPIFVCHWSKSPLWRIALIFWGLTGTERVTRTRRWERKAIKELLLKRLDDAKQGLKRQSGLMDDDLKKAESEWRKLIFKGEI